MTVILKFMTLTQQKFELNVETTDTVLDVKKKVYEFKGEGYETETLKLIFSGKILDNNKIISEYESLNLESGRLVAVGKNAKVELAQKKKDMDEARLEKSSKSKSSVSATQFEGAPLDLPPGPPDNLEELIESLVLLGIPENDAIYALELCNYNPDVAVDLILKTDIEEEFERTKLFPKGRDVFHSHKLEGDTTEIPSDTSEPRSHINDKPISFGSPPATTINEFMRHPIFKHMCKAVYQNPSLIIPMLNELKKHSPHIADYLISNPTELYGILTSFKDKSEVPTVESIDYTNMDPAELDHFIKSLSVDERLSIERICAMGFTSDIVVPVFYACDRDEVLTVEFLINNSEFYNAKIINRR